ncbi:MAG: MFS transporter [Treponema sp.]|jgi:MFS family permease|nr:MFS transporter [Treponema sp.]
MGILSYKHTLAASYFGYVTQAIVNNLGPLLFLTFQRQFGVSLGNLALLVSLNFAVQLLVDMAAVRHVDRIGYRAAAVAASIFSTAGLVSLGILPFVLPDPYMGLVTATVINAIGGGLLEVIISPIVEALPNDNKAAAMSLLHSFYCWGYVGVILLSTLYFNLAGITNWRYLPMLWALIPLGNIFLFSFVPLRTLTGEDNAPVSARTLFTKNSFLLLLLIMICSGASEQAMSQWASFFAEAGLKVSKTTGDLLGPCAFAVLMGTVRVFFGLKQEAIKLTRVLTGAGILCIASYFVTVFSPFPLLSLAGCAVCGFSVGIMWPGTFSLASKLFPRGGTAMFAILALAGDAGCASGPGLVGLVMDATTLKTGLLAAVVFPLLLACGVGLLSARAGKGDTPV